jgi:uroporphyrinogen-III synthase
MATRDAAPDFEGLRVLTLESRRAIEVASVISTYGGTPIVAPALREVPLESNTEALAFAAALLRGELDIVILLTGVGTRALASAVEPVCSREDFVRSLARTKVVARGPKPLAVLREMQVPVWIAVPEPNTWREVLGAMDARAGERPLRGARIAVQEYGVSSVELLQGLEARGAVVSRVPVYRWALPEDIGPLRNAVTALAAEQVDAVMFTTGVQLVHLWQIVQEMQVEPQVRRGLARAVVGSIGPSTTEELRRHGIAVDLEASHPKFGFLIRELAQQSRSRLNAKAQAPPSAGPT